MKKILAAAIAALTLGLTATALVPASAKGAHAAHAGKHRGAKLAKLSTALGLTDTQKAQIKPILQSAHQQAKAVKADTSLTPEAQKAKIKEIHKASRAQITALLTPDQAAKMKAMKHHHKAKA